MTSKRYAHDFSFNFTVHNDNPNQGDITLEQLIEIVREELHNGGGGMEFVKTWDSEEEVLDT